MKTSEMKRANVYIPRPISDAVDRLMNEQHVTSQQAIEYILWHGLRDLEARSP